MKVRRKENVSFRVAISGLLLAMMLIMGYIESLLPLPWAQFGVRLGISNGVLLFALYLLDIPTTVILMVLKVVLSTMMFGGGNLQKLVIALSGGALSLAGMIPLSRIKGLSMILVSVSGAELHNIGQILAATLFLHTTVGNLLTLLAVLLIVAVFTGAATGVLAKITIERLGHFVRKG